MYLLSRIGLFLAAGSVIQNQYVFGYRINAVSQNHCKTTNRNSGAYNTKFALSESPGSLSLNNLLSNRSNTADGNSAMQFVTKPSVTRRQNGLSRYDLVSQLDAIAAYNERNNMIQPLRMMEIGIFAGSFAEQNIEKMKELKQKHPKTPFEYHMVDLKPQPEFYPLLEKWKRELDRAGGDDQIVKIVYHEGKSTEIANQYTNEFFDILYIDASHTYKAVTNDIDAWLPRTKNSGIFSGHDYCVRENDKITYKNVPLCGFELRNGSNSDSIAKKGEDLSVDPDKPKASQIGSVRAVNDMFVKNRNTNPEYIGVTLQDRKDVNNSWYIWKKNIGKN